MFRSELGLALDMWGGVPGGSRRQLGRAVVAYEGRRPGAQAVRDGMVGTTGGIRSHAHAHAPAHNYEGHTKRLQIVRSGLSMALTETRSVACAAGLDRQRWSSPVGLLQFTGGSRLCFAEPTSGNCEAPQNKGPGSIPYFHICPRRGGNLIPGAGSHRFPTRVCSLLSWNRAGSGH